jgi:hypothetical protein
VKHRRSILKLTPYFHVVSAGTFDSLLPETAKNPEARAELNKRTSELPTISDVGKFIQDKLPGNADDPKVSSSYGSLLWHKFLQALQRF